MAAHQLMLLASLGPDVAPKLSGGSAGANVGIVQSLPEDQKPVALLAFSESLSTIWIMYVVFAGVGLGISAFITKNLLSKEHEETKTGLGVEEERRAEREAERQDRKDKKERKKASKGDLMGDVEGDIANGEQEKKVKV
jgi:hypothetical protein